MHYIQRNVFSSLVWPSFWCITNPKISWQGSFNRSEVRSFFWKIKYLYTQSNSSSSSCKKVYISFIFKGLIQRKHLASRLLQLISALRIFFSPDLLLTSNFIFRRLPHPVIVFDLVGGSVHFYPMHLRCVRSVQKRAEPPTEEYVSIQFWTP